MDCLECEPNLSRATREFPRAVNDLVDDIEFARLVVNPFFDLLLGNVNANLPVLDRVGFDPASSHSSSL